MDFLYPIAEVFFDFINSGPGLSVLGAVGLVVVGVPLVLLHELGHACVAAARLDSEVEVTVGNAVKVAQFRLGQVDASIHAFQGLNPSAGSASFDASRVRAEDMLWIALAGPFVSAICLVLSILSFSVAPADGVVHDLLWWAVVVNLFGVLNLIPLNFQAWGSAPREPTDGLLALDALRVIRELR